MAATTTQKNEEGHNIAGDYIGGHKNVDSLIIGDHNTITVVLNKSYELSKDELEKFKSYIPDNSKFPEFKNLIERIEFMCELEEYAEAKRFISEANCIYHNHPVLLDLNGLCEYATLDKVEVIKKPELIRKTIKLFEKAREIDEDIADFNGWNSSIALHFYEILSTQINTIKIRASRYIESYRHNDYYKAVAKHLIHFENCYRIHNDHLYIKEYILHLSGHKGYAWFHVYTSSKELDLGVGIFEGGAKNKLNKLVAQMEALDPSYMQPELKYGNYFEEPQPKNLVFHVNKAAQIIFYSILTAVVIGVSVLFLYVEMELILKIILVGYPILLALILHPLGNRKSVLQRLSSFLIRKLTNLLSRRQHTT